MSRNVTFTSETNIFGDHKVIIQLEKWGFIYKVCVCTDLILPSVRTLKSTPTLIFIKTVFDVEKCLASRQGLSRRTHFFLLECCRFLEM